SAFFFLLFFFNAPSTTEIYTLSLHDALPICSLPIGLQWSKDGAPLAGENTDTLTLPSITPANNGTYQVTATNLAGTTLSSPATLDRKSTRLNSSHLGISYAVFCLKKKNKKHK